MTPTNRAQTGGTTTLPSHSPACPSNHTPHSDACTSPGSSASRYVTDEEFHDALVFSSVQLRRIVVPAGGHYPVPKNHASGCLVRYDGALFLLSVAHAVKKGQWAAATGLMTIPAPGEQGIERITGIRLYKLGTPELVNEFSLKALDGTSGSLTPEELSAAQAELLGMLARHEADEQVGEPLDFGFFVIDEEAFFKFAPKWVLLNAKEETIISDQLRVIDADFQAVGSEDKRYGFSGLHFEGLSVDSASPEQPGSERFHWHVETDLKFLGTQGPYLRFRRLGAAPDWNIFTGCSGAPILSSDGELVALVAHGVKGTNELRGIAVQQFRGALIAALGK
jgi:hypothetical protein